MTTRLKTSSLNEEGRLPAKEDALSPQRIGENIVTDKNLTPIVWPVQLIDRAWVWVIIVAVCGGYAWLWNGVAA